MVEAAAEMGLNAGLIHRLSLPDAWIHQNSRRAQLEEVGLDPASIARAVRAIGEGVSPDRTTVEVRHAAPSRATERTA